MGVHLGVICIVIGSSLMFLVFFVYVFDKEKFVHICFITTRGLVSIVLESQRMVRTELGEW